MPHITLVCTGCHHKEEKVPPLSTCTACDAPLSVEYARPPAPSLPLPQYPGIWRYKECLPLHSAANIVSLGEGATPCIPLGRVGQRLGLAHLYAKAEYMNPTGSFKDRGTTTLVSMAREAGLRELVEDSSGNAGASLAAYCARADMRAIVFVPASAPRSKADQIRLYGADLRPVQGDRQAVAVAAQAYVREKGSFYGSHNLSPYFAEGMKSFAYELVNDLPGQPVQHIIFPVGNGSLLLGSSYGFLELKAAGALHQVPRLHCVQAQACMPTASLLTGQPWAPSGAVHTVAGGIAVPQPPRGRPGSGGGPGHGWRRCGGGGRGHRALVSASGPGGGPFC